MNSYSYLYLLYTVPHSYNIICREDEPEVESDDEDQQIYNPLKLPMGWDGKPIPYWLYKLHGLGQVGLFLLYFFRIFVDSNVSSLFGFVLMCLITFQEFKCEICGNYSYWGRRAYERHFKEFRQQYGMRRLGIPNTKNFNEITSIEVCLSDKLK